jgi:type II secretory pathway pseudopilin PulG
MNYEKKSYNLTQLGFSLIEVVLAIGIFLVTVLALVGLLGPTLQSVDEVEKTDEVSSVVNTVNSFLHNSPSIAAGSNFESIFKAVRGATDDKPTTIFVFRGYSGNDADVQLNVGFHSDVVAKDPVFYENAKARVLGSALADAAGTIYRVVLTPSSVMPEKGTDQGGAPVEYRGATRDVSTDTYTLKVDYDKYLEGSFAMEVRIYAEDPGPTFRYTKKLGVSSPQEPDEGLKDEVPVFTYNTAVVR